jgi:peptide/nickel transport system ATP-binding protein
LAAEDVVDLFPPAKGCPFQRRCPRRIGDICDTETPPWRPTELGHVIRCHIPLAELRGMQEQSADAVAAKLGPTEGIRAEQDHNLRRT